MRSTSALSLALVLAGCVSVSGSDPRGGKGAAELAFTETAAKEERVPDFRRWTHRPEAALSSSRDVRLERVSTGVPWPRGMVLVDGELVALARGRHRNAGGIDPEIEDHCGSLFRIDPDVAEPVVHGRDAGAAVRANARVLVEPQESTFLLYRPEAGEPIDQYWIDRPYCTLAYDEVSENYFICGYSGVDLPAKRFRKNATDSIHRFDTRTGEWSIVELHDADSVPRDELGYAIANDYYPHHDPQQNAAPHGWLNGPNGAWIAGDYLYAVGKDNHTLAQYDLSEIREDPGAGAPDSRIVMRDRVELMLDGEPREVQLLGHSALTARDGFLYVGFRTSSVVVRFPLDDRGDLVVPEGATLPRGELVAVFRPWSVETGTSANLIDLRFNSRGELFVSCAEEGRVWNIGVPDPARPFDGVDRGESPTTNRPYLDLRVATDNPKARVGNIAFDEEDRLYVCSGNYDSGTDIAGVIYRAGAL